MKVKIRTMLLIAIFLLTLTMQLVHNFSTQEFSSSSSYEALRNIESIKETGLPIINDNLSTNSIPLLSPPLFHYILALFSLILPTYVVAKLLPAIFISFLPLVVYLISHKISRNRNVSLFSSFMAGFIPIISTITINKVTSYSLAVPLMFLSLYFFLEIRKNKNYSTYSILTFILAILTHPISVMLIVAYLIYLLIQKIENYTIDYEELEIIGFNFFFLLWTYFLFYKTVLLQYGPNIIWKNIPVLVDANTYSNIGIFDAILQIGIIPFIFGLFVTYLFFFKYKKKTNYLFISLTITPFILLFTKIISLSIALTFLGITLILLFSLFYKNFLIKIEKTIFSKYKMALLLFIVFLFILTSALPTMKKASENIDEAYNDDYVKTAEWILNNTKTNSIILTTDYEGNFISYKTGRKNVITTNFLRINNPKQVITDVEKIYTTYFQNEALETIEKYNINYILLTTHSKEKYNIEEIAYTKNQDCFKTQYNNNFKVIKSICRLKVTHLD